MSQSGFPDFLISGKILGIIKSSLSHGKLTNNGIHEFSEQYSITFYGKSALYYLFVTNAIIFFYCNGAAPTNFR